MKLGVPLDIKLSTRYFQFNREFTIRDVFDALVELITNCDDSYHRLFEKKKRNEDGGPILIERGGRVCLDNLKQFLSDKLPRFMPLPASEVV